LAAGTLALRWIDYQQLAFAHPAQVYTFVIAAGFLALGVYIGARVIGRPQPSSFDGNAKAQAALGISPRELTVLHEIAAGRSNKEIAAQLNVSPNTVKTHVAKLFEKARREPAHGGDQQGPRTRDRALTGARNG
jgi:DNA-binding CsgD family transcriptional regulator